MELGPVELVVLTFPGERADPDVVGAVAKVVSQGYVTVLDLVFISRLQDGQIRITDVDENLDDLGFGSLEIKAQTLVNQDDMEVIRDSLEPGTSAAIIVYEESWARGVASAVRKAGGEVALHVQVPRDAVGRCGRRSSLRGLMTQGQRDATTRPAGFARYRRPDGSGRRNCDRHRERGKPACSEQDSGEGAGGRHHRRLSPLHLRPRPRPLPAMIWSAS